MSNEDTTYYSDYENEPIGGGNPYYRCVHCGVSDPEINGRLEGHHTDCEYRLAKERTLAKRKTFSKEAYVAQVKAELAMFENMNDEELEVAFEKALASEPDGPAKEFVIDLAKKINFGKCDGDKIACSIYERSGEKR